MIAHPRHAGIVAARTYLAAHERATVRRRRVRGYQLAAVVWTGAVLFAVYVAVRAWGS